MPSLCQCSCVQTHVGLWKRDSILKWGTLPSFFTHNFEEEGTWDWLVPIKYNELFPFDLHNHLMDNIIPISPMRIWDSLFESEKSLLETGHDCSEVRVTLLPHAVTQKKTPVFSVPPFEGILLKITRRLLRVEGVWQRSATDSWNYGKLGEQMV